MAQAQGAHSTYDEPIATGGNREDLSDVLFQVSPTDTPFLTGCKKGKATATSHDWLVDALEPAAANANIEGDDANPVDAAPRDRLSNYTQILKKNAVVTGTQEKVLKGGGIKSEMAYQVSQRMKAIKTDCELAMVGPGNAKVAGNDTTAREMGSFESYMTPNTYFGGAGFVAPAGNGANVATPGTARAFTETILKDALQVLWLQSGGSENIMGLCGAHVRSVASTFSGSSTRFVSLDKKNLNASIDVYDGDYHTVTFTPDRFSDQSSMFLIDSGYTAIADMRSVFVQDLAKTGDSSKKEIVWETTLEICNPEAHIQIGALLTV